MREGAVDWFVVCGRVTAPMGRKMKPTANAANPPIFDATGSSLGKNIGAKTI